MEHHGLLLERMIREKGYSISEFAQRITVNRRTVYNWLNQPILSAATIAAIDKALNSDYFANISNSSNAKEKDASLPESGPLLAKYIELLEKYNDLLCSSYGCRCNLKRNRYVRNPVCGSICMNIKTLL
jgi:transcriptional regulator with XRE-family HTH domain